MAFSPKALLIIPLALAALASAPVFADTVIVEQAPPPRVVYVPAPPPPPVYYGHWGYGPRPYWVHPHYYAYPARPYYGGWHHGYGYWH